MKYSKNNLLITNWGINNTIQYISPTDAISLIK